MEELGLLTYPRLPTDLDDFVSIKGALTCQLNHRNLWNRSLHALCWNIWLERTFSFFNDGESFKQICG